MAARDVDASEGARSRRRLLKLSLGAVGVVYGDIGTSPIYALRECFWGPHAVPRTEGNVLGILSLITWALILIVSIKYLTLILRADYRGEGGILALMARAAPLDASIHRRKPYLLVLLGVFGAALLYGDGAITPAISVLSAVEGLEVATPHLGHWVVPITVAILVALFAVQSRGTARVGGVFGPITLLWFIVIGALGMAKVVAHPGILVALSPVHGVRFFLHNGVDGFKVLAAVVLVVTGCEALYADLGHFGPRPIRLTWFTVALPALLASYFGQGANLLDRPEVARHPFFHLAPSWALIPLLVLATAATVIASQAIISGAYSLSRQAIMLGYLPRLRILHTSTEEVGQVYVPLVNWLLMVVTVGLVMGFGSSSRLAAAYGVAVTMTMFITTILASWVMVVRWRWPALAVLAGALAYAGIDLAFLSANTLKLWDGGWIPIAIASGLFVIMSTWNRGRSLEATRTVVATSSIDAVARELAPEPGRELPRRLDGTGVYFTGTRDVAPVSLLYNLRQTRTLHERVLLLHISTSEGPAVPFDERVEVRDLGAGLMSVIAHYGFAESPKIHDILWALQRKDIHVVAEDCTFFVGKSSVRPTETWNMARWRRRLFSRLARNANRPTDFFELPPLRVVELATPIG